MGSLPVRGLTEAKVRKRRLETGGCSELDAPEDKQYWPDQVIYERAKSRAPLTNHRGIWIQTREALCYSSGGCLAQALGVGVGVGTYPKRICTATLKQVPSAHRLRNWRGRSLSRFTEPRRHPTKELG